MSIKSIWRWFVGDDEPLGPESERGLFAHYNRPESLPWPPVRQFRPPHSVPNDTDYKWDSITGDRENHSSAAYYEEEQRRFFAEERRKHIEWLNQLFPKSGVMFIDPDEPRELKPTVGYFYDTGVMTGPPRAVPYTVRPDAVVDALRIGDTHPDVYEYIVHLESHFARTHHHAQ